MPDSRLEALLQKSMGLSMQTVGTGFIDLAVKARMLKASAYTADDYLRLVESDPAELQELVEAIVVPETWFFRDAEAFAALGKWAADEWAPRHPGAVLRVLSVPCSTGEEAYSIAICLLNAGLLLSRFRVEAMDISVRNLRLAQAGVYRPYAFRGMAPEVISRFFRQTAAGLQIDEAIRAQVSFCQGNVLQSLEKLPAGGFDAVFCRNLLIYFDRSTQLQTFGQIGRLLGEGGVLFVGSAEAFMARAFGCEALNHPMSFGFRLCGQTLAPPPIKKPDVATASTKARPLPATTQLPPRPPPAVNPYPKPPLPAASAAAGDDYLAQAKLLADRGEFASARTSCEAAISRRGDCADCYFLLGLIDDAEDRPDKAAAHYRKALYLDPRHAEALAHMALLFERLGDSGNAERFRLRAHRGRPSDTAAGTK